MDKKDCPEQLSGNQDQEIQNGPNYPELTAEYNQGMEKKEKIQLPMILATQEEVKEKLKKSQELDEAKVIKHLASREKDTSVSTKIIETWNLDRTKTREILQYLSKERKLQTTFINLIGATRFKAVKDGKLHHTKCPRCQEVDSWEHCMKCYGLQIHEGQGKEAWLQSIEKGMKLITTDTPAIYQPTEILHESRLQT